MTDDAVIEAMARAGATADCTAPLIWERSPESFKERWRKIMRAAAAACEAAQWQDIATAPKDGTKVLLYAITSAGSYFIDLAAHTYLGWPSYLDGTITHWRPLPEPPEVPR